MGIVLNKISIEDYMEKDVLYSKLIRGKLEFYIETHYLEGGKHIQIFLYRNHPRIKEFIECDKVKHHLTKQESVVSVDNKQLRFSINDKSFMISTSQSTTIRVIEYNFNQQLSDFAKGKIAVLIDIELTDTIDNSKTIREIKNYNMEEQNEGTSNTSID